MQQESTEALKNNIQNYKNVNFHDFMRQKQNITVFDRLCIQYINIILWFHFLQSLARLVFHF